MRIHFTLAAILLASCGGELLDDGSTQHPDFWHPEDAIAEDIDKGQSGTEEPDRCAEKQRDAVTDTSLAAAGFSYSVDQLLGNAGGAFGGTIALSDSEPSLSVIIAPAPGTIYAVETEWVTGGGSGSGMGGLGMSSAEIDCQPYYELPMTLSVESGALLNDAFEVIATSREVDQLAFIGAIDPADIVGTTQPNFNPGNYDSYSLGLFGTVSMSVVTGSVVWHGINEAPPPPPPQESCEIGGGITGCIDPDTQECGACVGSTGPPSIIEFLGHFTAQQ